MHYYNEFDPKAAAWLRELIRAGLIPAGEVDERSIVDVQPSDLVRFRQCHFFAGIGGWPYALKLAGWPEDREVWTLSCPCQPFSDAGKKLGAADERHLWPQAFRLIKERKPQIVFGEQVASTEVVGSQLEAAFIDAVQGGDFAKANKLARRLTQSSGFHFTPRWLDGISADLEAERYSVWPMVLGAHSVGAPHIRQRLYWMAYAEGKGRARVESERQAGIGERPRAGSDCAVGGLVQPDSAGRESGRQAAEADGYRGATESTGSSCGVEHSAGEQVGIPGRSREQRESAGGMGNAVQPGLEGHAGNGDDRNEPGRIYPAADRSASTAGGAGAWDNFDIIPCADGKARRIESGSFPLAYGIPGRVGLLRGYGNAIVPQVAAEFIRACEEAITQPAGQ